MLKPLTDMPDVAFYSLQVGPARDAFLQDPRGVTDLVPGIADYLDTACAISALDLVISVDTSVAHLAGALGKPVWTLLPLSPDWRWMLGRADTPWYPNMRLFRQPGLRDWPAALQQVMAALSQMRPDAAHPAM
jgi:hypothetical protein